jgi:hypothetical protein
MTAPFDKDDFIIVTDSNAVKSVAIFRCHHTCVRPAAQKEGLL